jgi:hypothetical protein
MTDVTKFACRIIIESRHWTILLEWADRREERSPQLSCSLGSREGPVPNIPSFQFYPAPTTECQPHAPEPDVVVIGYEWRFRHCVQRCEFSIVPIRDHDKGVGIVSKNRRHSYSIRSTRPTPPP